MVYSKKAIFLCLFFSIFTAVTGAGIVVPLLPVYARDLGAGGFYIAMVFGAFSVSRTLALPYFGRLSDQKGRKPFITAGLLAYGLVSLSFVFVEGLNALSAMRFIQGLASAVMIPAIQAYVADISPRGQEGKIMGVFHMSMFFGLTAGPLAGGLIHDRLGMDAAFLCMSGLSFAGFLLSFFLLPPARLETYSPKNSEAVAWRELLSDGTIAGAFVFRFSYTVCIGVIWGFLPVFADARLSLSSSAIGTLIMLGVLVNGALHTPMGYLADRLSKRTMIAAGGLLTSLGLYLLGNSVDFQDMLIANILFGAGGGISMPALMAMAAIAGKKTRASGSVMALMTMAHSLGMMSGAFAAGAVMDLFALSGAFSLAAGTMLAGLFGFIFLALFKKKTRPGGVGARV
ncbi:MFS transporter [Candidatus Desulfarcum epimagneticum]|uniref:MFS transporter n=1 Tax=uncultured Desulfobacteraceae bacterium TaxID=218296 RepID=A0A484HII9_9BACT|nr:MFS transporter [uncultured Desulfobacteraceae bacterium]